MTIQTTVLVEDKQGSLKVLDCLGFSSLASAPIIGDTITLRSPDKKVYMLQVDLRNIDYTELGNIKIRLVCSVKAVQEIDDNN